MKLYFAGGINWKNGEVEVMIAQETRRIFSYCFVSRQYIKEHPGKFTYVSDFETRMLHRDEEENR